MYEYNLTMKNNRQDIVIQELDQQTKRGVLLVVSGASGAGKDTVMKLLLQNYSNMQKLVTTNSRPKRPEEVEGYDYYFVSKEEFERLIAEDAFFEWVEYRGHYRGGQKRHVAEALASGKDVIWRIDVKGVKNIKKKVKEMFPYSVFVLLVVRDLDTLEKRMIERASENNEELSWSLDMAIWEQKQFKDFDYLVPNEDGNLEETVSRVAAIVEATRMRVVKDKKKN